MKQPKKPISTKKSIDKHFYEINDWEYYYDYGNVARKSSIKNQIEALNSCILEDAFDNYLEKKWESIYNIHKTISIKLCEKMPLKYRNKNGITYLCRWVEMLTAKNEYRV